MSILTGIKLALIAAALLLAYHLGGDSARTALEGFQAAQAENTAKAVLAERASGAAELARVNAILKGYQDAPIDPIVPGIAHRVFLYASAASCAVSSTPSAPGGVVTSRPVPASDSGLEQATQAVFDACERDALRLNALQAAWPQ